VPAYLTMTAKPHIDLFGDALVDHQNGRHGRMLTIRRDDDHVDSHDPSLYFAEAPFEHEARLLERAEGRVLDVGCGAGRTLLWLRNQGVAAIGIDLSPGAVAVCQRRGCEDVRLMDIMSPEADAISHGAFRTAVLFGNNVGIGGTLEGAGHLLRRLARAVAPEGCLLVTGLDIAQTSDPHHLAYHRQKRARGRPIGEITMRFEYEEEIGPWMQWFHPTPDELRELAIETGWSFEEISSSGGLFYSAVLRNTL
jgi:SAM-dependent methyltransferase